MRFQTKLLFMYSLITILVIGVISGVYYEYSRRVFEKNAISNLELMTQKISQQLESVIKPMDYTLTQLFANETVMSSMSALAYLDSTTNENLSFINQSLREIRKVLYRDPIHKNFHRVNIYNERGFFFSSNFLLDNNTVIIGEVLPTLNWLEAAKSFRGKKYIIPPYMDPWTDYDIPVFGLVRAASGEQGPMGIIEVQVPLSELEQVFTVPESSNLQVAAILGRGDLFWRGDNTSKQSMNIAYELFNNGKIPDEDVVIHVDDFIVIHIYSSNLDMHFFMLQAKSDLYRPLSSTLRFVALVALLVLFMSLVFAFIMTNQVTKPLRKLKNSVAKVELTNISEVKFKASSNNEIQALNESFQDLLGRLSSAIEDEMKAQSLQMQASMDALQAQINPHFMYNILNVIANKGLKNGDEEIGDICNGIADMLRYSTSTIQRATNLQAELTHVKTYLGLMQTRHQHKLKYDIECDPTITHITLPKIVLQPLVENSIQHGFEDGRRIMEIHVEAKRDETNWHIYIRDNGTGFSDAKIAQIHQQMTELRDAVLSHKEQLPFEIGGMGLLQTYLRLFLFFKGNIVFEVSNNEVNGAEIHFSAAIDTIEEDGSYYV